MVQTTEVSTLLILVGSPRRNGNSAMLAEAVRRGAEKSGVRVKTRFLDDYVGGFLRDCRQCRRADGTCSINDRYRELFMEDFLPAEGVVFSSPVYWYGISAQMKAFFDRTFCYYAASYPDAEHVIASMTGKQLGLVLASEESYPGVVQGPVHQFQEYARYTHSRLVGVVRGIGNSRGEVACDPSNPLRAAEDLGRQLFSLNYSDYRLDTPRSSRVWSDV
jgi:multimeric flavodoxin WrbA